MIHIQDKNVENQVYFPKSTNIVGDLVLKLHSELTQKDYTFDVVNESKTSNYYKFNVNFKSVENGEYTYFINNTDSGLIRIGNVDEAVSTSTYIDGIEVVQYYPQDVKETNYSKEPLTFKILSYGTINWTTSDSSLTKTIEYKLNDGEWTHITSNTEPSASAIVVTRGNKIQFRGDNTSYSDGLSYNTFGSSTAEFEVEGNIMSLIDSTDFSTLTTLQDNYTFYNLFSNCTGLTSAKNLVLPAITLAENCYGSMFRNCTSLTIAPALPATNLAESCYSGMFGECKSLTTAPELPATTLDNNCYGSMFRNCTSLITAPALPATTLANNCYGNMFYSCTSLTTAPSVLPATTLNSQCYQRMFLNCSSLTTAPALPSTTLKFMCYSGMFQNCTKLNYIKCLATDISASDCTKNWVSGVSSTGTFIKNPNMTSWPTGMNGIPDNWTIENNI